MQDTQLRIGPGTAPPEIVSALQEIDPRAELIHLEGERWWLGIRAENPKAREDMASGQAKLLARRAPVIDDPVERAIVEAELGVEYQMRQVMAMGFRPVSVYRCEKAPGHEIVEDFRIRDYNWRTQTQAQQERALKDSVSMEALNRPRIAHFAKMAKEAASEAYRYTMRAARSVLVGANLE